MNTLLAAAIVLLVLSVAAQAAVLIAMYRMSRRVAGNVNGLIAESRRVLAPIEDVTQNMRTTSGDFIEIGKAARQQMRYVDYILADARNYVRETAADIRQNITSPFRSGSALALAAIKGVRAYFSRPRRDASHQDVA